MAIALCCLATSLSVWLLAIRAPLWLDETISYWQIHGGAAQIFSRQGGLSALAFPLYPYILWGWTKIFGSSELALRVPHVLAMLGAVYLLYLAARELFDTDVAIVAAIVFSLHPIVVFAAIDVRPYAFAALTICASIYVVLRLRRSGSDWLAALFGFLGACVVYFQFLFAVLLPALAICYFALKMNDRKNLWRQFGLALMVLALAFLPLIPGMQYMFHTSGSHVWAAAPTWMDFALTLAPGLMVFLALGAAAGAAATRRLEVQKLLEGRRLLVCASLGLLPLLILFFVSRLTPIHIFVERYRLVALPGVALCWALLISLINSRTIRLLFCVALVAVTAVHDFNSPLSRLHGYTWKYALQVVERGASMDNAPVLICSDLPESNSMPIPVGEAVKDSDLFAPLTYYKLTVPVVGLPRALNAEAVRIGSNFLRSNEHRRFFLLGFGPSLPTLRWFAANASATHEMRELGVYSGVAVLEFIPRN